MDFGGPGLVEQGGVAPSGGTEHRADIPETVFESLYKVWEIKKKKNQLIKMHFLGVGREKL